MGVGFPSGALIGKSARGVCVATLTFALAACASEGGKFDPVRGTNGCDFTPIGRTYMRAGMLDYFGLRRSLVLGYERNQGRGSPMIMARIAVPDGSAGEGVQRMALAWTANRSERLSCSDLSGGRSRVCIATVTPPLLMDMIVHFDPDVADAEPKTRALLEYVQQDVICGVNTTGAAFPQWQ